MILDTMSSTWRFQQMYKASQLTKQRRKASLKMIRNHISNTNIKEFCTTCNQDKIPQAVRMFFLLNILITVAHLFPDNWFALVVNSKILQALPTFFPFRLPRETNCDGKLAKCNYDFRASERISLCHLPTTHHALLYNHQRDA